MRIVARLCLAGIALAVAAAGCSGPPPNPGPVAPSTAPSPSPKSEGPAGTPATYPNGLVVHLTGMQRLNPMIGYGLTLGMMSVKVTVTVTNAGTQPWEIPGYRLWTVLYGPNRQEASPVAGAGGDDSQVQSTNPTRIAPGQTVTMFASSAIPTRELGDLAVRLDVDQAAPYTFTDAHRLLDG